MAAFKAGTTPSKRVYRKAARVKGIEATAIQEDEIKTTKDENMSEKEGNRSSSSERSESQHRDLDTSFKPELSTRKARAMKTNQEKEIRLENLRRMKSRDGLENDAGASEDYSTVSSAPSGPCEINKQAVIISKLVLGVTV